MANGFLPSEERKQRELERLTNPTTLHKESHKRSDVDNAPGAQHHTIGKGAHQAASGAQMEKLRARIVTLEADVADFETRIAFLEGRDHVH